MENSEAISGESGHRLTAAGGAEDVTFGVAAVTLGWLVLTLLLAAEPFVGLAVDPPGSVYASAMHFGFFLGVSLPMIALLALAAYFGWKARGRDPLGPTRIKARAGLVSLVALAWLVVSLLLRSEPGFDFLAGILWLLFTGGLAVAWFSILIQDSYRFWKAHGLTEALTVLDYLIPLPLAAVALFAVIPGRAPLEARFNLSEAALTRYVEEYERTGGESASVVQFVGLYSVGEPYRRDGCLILPTQGGLDYLAGFAYCTGSLPDKPNVDMDHIKGRWWTYEINH